MKFVKTLQKLGIIALSVTSLSACSSIAIVTCELKEVPALPTTTTLEDRTVVILEEDDMADLLLYFDSHENCINRIKL